MIFTNEPKNVQGILATQFCDFDVGELRRQATIKLLGHAIFNADGAYWEHSRALIRPNFARKQVGDLNLMEHHVMHMIRGATWGRLIRGDLGGLMGGDLWGLI